MVETAGEVKKPPLELKDLSLQQKVFAMAMVMASKGPDFQQKAEALATSYEIDPATGVKRHEIALQPADLEQLIDYFRQNPKEG